MVDQSNNRLLLVLFVASTAVVVTSRICSSRLGTRLMEPELPRDCADDNDDVDDDDDDDTAV